MSMDNAEHSSRTRRPTTRVFKLETPKREKEVQLHFRKMGLGPIYHESLRFEHRTKPAKIWDRIATTQDTSNDPKCQRTKAGREAPCSGFRNANIDKTGRAAAVQEPVVLHSLLLNLGTLTR